MSVVRPAKCSVCPQRKLCGPELRRNGPDLTHSENVYGPPIKFGFLPFMLGIFCEDFLLIVN